jgi:3-hydroxyisobutyrate dehydrogenase-like beta-hydroxyacid dehydrogenase
MTVIAVIGAGAMGSGMARLLVEGGADVITSMDGRSEATRKRAAAVGLRETDWDEIVSADIILSIIPPSEAVDVATKVGAQSAASGRTPVFVDCNAIAPETMAAVAAAAAAGGARVVDGSIIGMPPVPASGDMAAKVPKLYLSGGPEGIEAALASHGLKVTRLEGEVGAASALKMCYSGINKGLVGLGTAMYLAAIRAGADDGLRRELVDSVPQVADRLARGIPDMYAKAYRWVAEMDEIADFLGKHDPASQIFRGMAGLYRKMADDRDADGALAAALDAMIDAK